MKFGKNVLFWTGIYAGSGLIFGRGRIVVVDTQMRRDQASLMVELMKLHRLNPKNVKHIINTHSDLDHVGGNAELKRLTGAKILAHVKDVPKIESVEERVAGQTKFMAARNEPQEPCKVDTLIEDDTELRLGRMTLRILWTPGHTPGSICVYEEDSGCLFTGDTVLGLGRPYAAPLIRLSSKAIIESLKRLAGLRISWLLPGHGDPVKDGRRRITDSIRETEQLPQRILRLLEDRPHTSSEISEELLVWPQTVDTILLELEKQGKVQRIEKETPQLTRTWTAI